MLEPNSGSPPTGATPASTDEPTYTCLPSGLTATAVTLEPTPRADVQPLTAAAMQEPAPSAPVPTSRRKIARAAGRWSTLGGTKMVPPVAR